MPPARKMPTEIRDAVQSRAMYVSGRYWSSAGGEAEAPVTTKDETKVMKSDTISATASRTPRRLLRLCGVEFGLMLTIRNDAQDGGRIGGRAVPLCELEQEHRGFPFDWPWEALGGCEPTAGRGSGPADVAKTVPRDRRER